jgi:hypothetical protein
MIPAFLTAISTLAGLAKIVLGLVKTGIDIKGSAEKNAKERAREKAGAETAFKALRIEVEDNLSIIDGIKPERLKGLPVNDRAVKALVQHLSSKTVEQVYLYSQFAEKTPETEAFTRALFYTRKKIKDLKRLSSASGAELKLQKSPRLSVRLKNLRDYLHALRIVCGNKPGVSRQQR